jgi:Xaa-Pro aminopeptidase
MNLRITKLQNSLKTQNIPALFISNQNNVTYLTGFTGLSPNEREGFLLVTQKSAVLLTFPTYFALYKNGGDGFVSKEITATKRITDHVNDIFKDEHIQEVGFEKDNMTVSELESLQSRIQVKFIPTLSLIEDIRIVKDASEIQAIKKAASITDDAFTFIQTKIKKGVSEKELAIDLEFFMKSHTDDIAFTPIVAFNEHAAIPHHLSSAKSTLNTGSLILLDFGAKSDNYCADMTRVLFFGTPNEHFLDVYNAVKESQQCVLDALKPGVTGDAMDKLSREYIESKGFPAYTHGLGHGVGLAIHEAPRLRKTGIDVMKENIIVTVEPGIYLEGDCGVRIEDLVLLTSTGIDVLSTSTKEIITI